MWIVGLKCLVPAQEYPGLDYVSDAGLIFFK